MTWALVVSAVWLSLAWVVAILVGRAVKARDDHAPHVVRNRIEGETLRGLLRGKR